MKAITPGRPASRARIAELAYRIGIWLKAIDGLIELVTGVLLWVAPSVLRAALAPIVSTDADDRFIRHLVATAAGRLDTGIAAGAPQIIIIFLLSHGIIKLVLAYCLIRGYHWVYPYAIGVLGLFALYQIYAVIRSPSIGSIIFLLLDLVIVALIWREARLVRAR
ncbi:DUF2127 domain-containing protein [Glaciibacter psychrotolerans]|uniref:Putative membrane protein n=1 Tax=Glaciibacter psychrotolerans TaxID=670054 RepID=A0A7Z0J5L1_9MICO|nr:DUF2127 domain-containing protein [Leifsonia psychrotolerans]NYJ18953.1 putative membrane protein [Leifsonia psychrotolerans]